MTFRRRLVLWLVVAAIVPLLLGGLGARREIARRLTAQAEGRVAALVDVIRGDLTRDAKAVRDRLAALAGQLADDNRFRRASVDPTLDREWLLDWAGGAMRAAGLASLQLQDESGRILSSGHFRNEYDRLEPRAPATLAAAGHQLALVEARAADGPFLVLAALDSLSVAGRRFSLVGGVRMDAARLGSLSRGELGVALAAADSVCLPAAQRPGVGPGHPDTGQPPGSGAEATTVTAGGGAVPIPHDPNVPILPCRPGGSVADIALILAGGDGEPGRVRLMIVGDPTAIPALLASLDRWLLLAAALALALALALAVVLGRALSAPLAELAERTDALDLDRLDQIFATGRSDEIGAVEDGMSRLTRRLRQSVEALRAAERRAATGDLARQINHDVKNGLVPIRNVLRHLSEVATRDPASLPAIYTERRPTLESSIDYLDGLARSYARLAPALNRTSCRVNALARDLAAAPAPPGTEITTRLDPGDPAVRGDPVAIRRMLENLLSNAVDALDGGGRIELATERAATGDRGLVRIAVTDTGRGMSREELDRAFGDFYTTKPGGTGLGLSVVRRLVGDLGGNLRVETAPGEGSRFILEIPEA